VTFSGNGLDANTILPVLIDGNHVADVNTDGGGSFSVQLAVPDIGAGGHQVCVSESNGNACAGFTVEAAPASTPTPTSSPSPSPSPSPSGSPPALATIPTSGGTSPLALLIKPPFVFLPIIAAIALLAFLALYLWRVRPTPPIGEVTILHKAPPPRVYESLPEAPPPIPAPQPAPIFYESPGGPQSTPPPERPPAPPSGADVPPDLPEASD
jgi:hypothetical protein